MEVKAESAPLATLNIAANTRISKLASRTRPESGGRFEISLKMMLENWENVHSQVDVLSGCEISQSGHPLEVTPKNMTGTT